MSATVVGADGRRRCAWAESAPEFPVYHDQEWGFPVANDTRLFEKVCLESFQSGLSWRTILVKRENFRRAFHGFDFRRVAQMDDDDVARLMHDEGIVRNRAKIEATIHNAARAIEMVAAEDSLAAFVWRFEADTHPPPGSAPRSTSPESVALAKEMKRRGWRFVGPTTAYAFMQAMGLVNDHHPDCIVNEQVIKARQAFQAPGR